MFLNELLWFGTVKKYKDYGIKTNLFYVNNVLCMADVERV